MRDPPALSKAEAFHQLEEAIQNQTEESLLRLMISYDNPLAERLTRIHNTIEERQTTTLNGGVEGVVVGYLNMGREKAPVISYVNHEGRREAVLRWGSEEYYLGSTPQEVSRTIRKLRERVLGLKREINEWYA